MPKIEHFDELNETGKWLICHLLTYVPDKILWAQETPDVEIRINGYLVEDLDHFFDDAGRAMDDAITREADDLARLHVESLLEDIRQGIMPLIAQRLEDQGDKCPG